MIKDELRSAYPKDWVRPEIHSPDQREGDLANVALFPNPALQKGDGRVSELEPAPEPQDRKLEPDVTQQPEARGSEANPSQPRTRIPEASMERPADTQTAGPSLWSQATMSSANSALRQAGRPLDPRPPQQQEKARTSSFEGQREGSTGNLPPRRKRWRVIRWLWSHPKLSVVMAALLIAIIVANLASQTATTPPSSGELLEPASPTAPIPLPHHLILPTPAHKPPR